MEETGGNIDLAGENFCLIDFSSENDSLIASDASSSTPTDYPSPGYFSFYLMRQALVLKNESKVFNDQVWVVKGILFSNFNGSKL